MIILDILDTEQHWLQYWKIVYYEVIFFDAYTLVADKGQHVIQLPNCEINTSNPLLLLLKFCGMKKKGKNEHIKSRLA